MLSQAPQSSIAGHPWEEKKSLKWKGNENGKTLQMSVMDVDVIPTMQARLRPQLN